MPGLLAVTSPRKSARGREKDSLIVYLMLSGNAIFSSAELSQLTGNAAGQFYQSPGSLTTALRKATESINASLLERNLSTTGRGQYALGFLVLAAVRESQCTLLFCGPTHAVWTTEGQSRHIYDPALSGKGLGSSQTITSYFSQVDLHPQDLLVLCGKFPKDWEADLLNERPPASLDASYRKLTFTKGDLNAILIQAQTGHGTITILRPEIPAAVARPPSGQLTPASVIQESTAPQHEADVESSESGEDIDFPLLTSDHHDEEIEHEQPSISEDDLDTMADFAAHVIQPSAYAIPPQPEEMSPVSEETNLSSPRNFPPSIPRARSSDWSPSPIIESKPELETENDEDTPAIEESTVARVRSDKPSAHAEATRQIAKTFVGGIRTGRRVNERVGSFMQRFIPRLLPSVGPEASKPFVAPTYAMVFIAVVIPVLVVTIASIVYLRFGQSVQYDELYSQALNARAQAVSETEPVRQRDAWQNVLKYLDKADGYRETNESKALRADAQSNLDNLMGIIRLEFIPAFTNGLGSSTQISRLAASESDLYMLDAERGNILHASFTGRSLDLDNAFNCQPGTYAGYQVGTLVDILALPKVNAVNSTVLGIDAGGNLLYCAPGQVPQALPLPSLPNTNWGRITAFALDNGNLYVLDAASRSVWVFVGKDSTFVDTPYFYFGNQIPNIDNAIDVAVGGDDLYLLHADGHISTCTFSRLNEVPTRCIDPVSFNDAFPAHVDINVFARAHFTQMSLTNPPNSVILLLDSDNQSVFRFSPRSLELQNQVTGHAGQGNPFRSGPIGAMTVSPNYVLYLAIGDQVYFATNLP